MTMRDIAPIRDEDLHAWLDGELAPERRAEVEAYVRDNPAEGERVEAFRRDRDAIARLFSAVGARSAAAPATAAPTPVQRRRHPLTARPWLRAAAALLLFAAGGLAGWYGRGGAEAEDWQAFAAQATATHLLFAAGGGETIPTDSVAVVNQTLSAALGTRLALRDLAQSGYVLTGGRLLPGAERVSVQLSFRSPAGESFSLQMQRKPDAEETPFHRVTGDKVATVVWEDDDHGLICAVTGSLSPDRLQEIARTVYRELLI
jgi:anti-sigma factor RsiW